MQTKRNTTQHELDVIQNNTCEDAMRILGFGRTTIHNICRANNVMFKRLRAMPNTGKYGNRAAMKVDFKNGMTIAEIGRKYGMLGSKVRDILQHKPHGPVFQHLPIDVVEWLDQGSPKGMTIYEYAAIIIREVYEGETE